MIELPLLQRREIEARILAPIIRSLAERFGREQVHEVVAETVRGLAREHGAALAGQLPGNDLSDLARVLALWMQDGALEVDRLREDDEHFDFNVTRCRFAELYERLGIADLGPILSCNRDFCFAEGFNPELELRRTQTLMEGASHCDFRFSRKAAQEGDGSSPS
ncbi:MAG: L-2-amino-thiazoline-4-carboxylic acid hydrolase [Planctomycetota bacterium]|jgi:predicted hydrocarbon binding protein